MRVLNVLLVCLLAYAIVATLLGLNWLQGRSASMRGNLDVDYERASFTASLNLEPASALLDLSTSMPLTVLHNTSQLNEFNTSRSRTPPAATAPIAELTLLRAPGHPAVTAVSMQNPQYATWATTFTTTTQNGNAPED